MNVTVSIPYDYLPAALLDDPAKMKRWVITESLAAIEEGLPPLMNVKGQKQKMTLYLPTQAKRAIQAVQPADISTSVFMAGLVCARGAKARVAERAAAAVTPSAMEQTFFRPEQHKLIQSIEENLSGQNIVMCEAGTGIGKTFAALTVAARKAHADNLPVVYAVPTITVLGQALRDYQKLVQAGAAALDLTALPPVRFMIGRSAFVSPAAISNLLAESDEWKIDAETIAAVTAWMAAGAAHVDGAKTHSLHEAWPGLCWLAEDLRQCAPAFPVELVVLSSEDKDAEVCPAHAAYAELRAVSELEEAAVVICTHAMLGIHVRLREQTPMEMQRRLDALLGRQQALKDKRHLKPVESQILASVERQIASLTATLQSADEDGAVTSRTPLLPSFSTLLIDEAHQFESAMANLMTSHFNPRMVLHELKEAQGSIKGTKKAISELSTSLSLLHQQLRDFGMRNMHRMDDKRVPLMRQEGEKNSLAASSAVSYQQLATIKSQMQLLSQQHGQLKRILHEPLRIITRMIDVLTERPGDMVWVCYSPRLSFPSLQSGPQSVRLLMERIWGQVNNAVLMSATMMLPNNEGIYKPSQALLSALAAPLARVVTLPPLTQDWLYSPTLHIEAANSIAMQEALQGVDQQSFDDWVSLVTDELLKVADSARGGCLVLLTSYERINAIAKAMSQQDKALKERLIVQGRDGGVRKAQASFETKAMAGKKPIWLAVGPAWTGLDIQDHSQPAEHDFWLTDLVIPKLPFGTNNSSVHQSRMRYNFRAEMDRAALEFKQGLGRLMRRKGLTDRRIHLLDARLYHPSKSYAVFRQLIQPYRKG